MAIEQDLEETSFLAGLWSSFLGQSSIYDVVMLPFMWVSSPILHHSKIKWYLGNLGEESNPTTAPRY